MTTRNSDSGRLRDLLRRGDPARDEGLAPQDVARLRLRLEAEAAAGGRQPAWSGRLAWGALAAALFLAAVLLRFGAAPAPPPPAAPSAPAPVEMAANAEARQVQFVTSKGTRIVWVLSPNLNL